MPCTQQAFSFVHNDDGHCWGFQSARVEVHRHRLPVMRTESSWQTKWQLGALGADTINAETGRWVRRPSPPTLWLDRDKGLANPGNLWCGEYVLLVAEWGSSSKSDCLYERVLWVQRAVFYPLQLCHWERSYPCCQTKPYISQILNVIQCYLFLSFES